MKHLLNHYSLGTAYKVDDYPYGFKLRTSIYYWIETTPKRGDRFCSCTMNPKTGRMNEPKKSTYSNIAFMYLNEDNHVKWCGVGIYTKREAVEKFAEIFGLDNFNKEQRKQYNQLLGINEVKTDEFTGEVKKDFTIKWETEVTGKGWEKVEKQDGTSERVWNKGVKGKAIELKITFDRPDGVKLGEIFKAMKTVNQTKLNEVFEIREDKYFGDHAGVVRIYCRGGVYLGSVSEESYKEFLASDENQIEEEAKQNQLNY